MVEKTSRSFDFSALQAKVQGQFQNLDPKDPSVWPSLPRYALFVVTAIVVVAVLWFLWLTSSLEVLEQEQEKEVKLRADYKIKLAKAVNLDVLKKQREQVQQYVT